MLLEEMVVWSKEKMRVAGARTRQANLWIFMAAWRTYRGGYMNTYVCEIQFPKARFLLKVTKRV